MSLLTRNSLQTIARLIFLLFVLISVHIADTNARELFKISPYLLLHSNQHLLLNFQLNDDQELIIEDETKTYSSQTFYKNQQYQIELSKANCGSDKEIRIYRKLKNANGEKGDILFNKRFPVVECKKSNTDEEFVFGFISDTQEYEDRHNEVARIIAHHHSLSPLQFIVNGGDVVQNGDEEDEWFKYFQGGKAYLMDIPQIAAIGNHDYRGFARITLPPLFKKYMRWENADPYGNIAYEFNNFSLLVFNSNFQISIGAAEKVLWEWIERHIVEAKKKNKPVIIATHFPAYSSSLNRYTAEGVAKIRRTLVPMLEKYKVPLLLSGHTHMYERSFKDNVHYVVAGPAGGRPNSPSDKNPYKVFGDSKALTFTKLIVSKKQISIETFNEANLLIDQLTIPL